MENFTSAPLSFTGRPILLENEVELKSESQVSVPLQSGKKVTGELLCAGYLTLTNFRLITVQSKIDKGKTLYVGWGIELKNISLVQDCASLFKHSTRLRICFSSNQTEIGLRFEKDGKEEFLVILNKALEKRSWERNMVTEKATEAAQEETVFSSTNAGVAGILRRQEKNMQSVDTLAKSALTDLDALMLRAREAIAVVQRYASYTAGDFAEFTILSLCLATA